MGNPSIACTLTPDALRTRREGLIADAVRRAERRELLADGVRLTFGADDDTLSAILRMVDAERQCCRFLGFVITVEPEGGPIVLELAGPPGTRDFLAALLDSDD